MAFGRVRYRVSVFRLPCQLPDMLMKLRGRMMTLPASAAFEEVRQWLGANTAVSADALHHILPLFKPLTLAKSEHLIRAGDYVPILGLLVEGLMRHYFLRNDGAEVTVEFARVGDLVGEYNNMLTDQPADHYVQALEPCLIMAAPVAELRAACDRFPDLDRLSRYHAEQYLHRIIAQMSQYMLRRPEERYQHLLTHDPDLIQRVPQLILASYVGVTPVTLSRIRKRLVHR